MLSGFITGKLYMGPAPIALAIGAILGPRAASVLDPQSWAQTTTVTLEFSRIVIALQTFGNAIELPRAYVQRHWKSLAYIIGPVMLGGWLITTCCIKIMVPSFTWREALACAACFNAIDPVLAGTVLSGRFSKRVPKHIRDLLRTEAAANGLTTTLILNLATNIVQPNFSLSSYIKSFFVSLGYECVFGAVAGFLIGYLARGFLRQAHKSDRIDRPSFLAYYLSVALFSTGFGTITGVDEITLAFFAGVGLDNNNWYEEKTEESFLSSCIDLMLNLCYFAYIGSLVPWNDFSSQNLALVPWRLVVGTLCIFTIRRLPLILLFKRLIPDIKTWREASFYGHFGPLGAGSLFSALLVQGKLTPGPRDSLTAASDNLEIRRFISQIWVIVMFVIVCSSIVHGMSIAIFSLGKGLNTTTISMSYTHASEDDPAWMDRLPHVQPRSTILSTPETSISAESTPNPNHENTIKDMAPAVAYQTGNSIVVEDEDGEVLKVYNLPTRPSANTDTLHIASTGRQGTKRVSFQVDDDEVATASSSRPVGTTDDDETPVERRRRLAALGLEPADTDGSIVQESSEK